MRLINPRFYSGAGPNTPLRKLKGCLAGACLLISGLLPIGALGQITELVGPLLPAPTVPTVPSQPATAPGQQPSYAGETVTTRPRPEFDAIGLRFDDYFWFPRAELDESYNSNIFATSSKPTTDFITALVPSFDLISIFPRNSLNLHGSSVLDFYAKNPSQNTQDGNVSVDGRYDVTAGSSFFGNAQVAHQHISYGSPNSPVSPNSPGGIAEPVTYWTYSGRAGYVQGGRRLSWGVDFGSISAQYNAAPLVGGGISPQSSQDATISDVAVRVSYEIAPDYQGYVRLDGALYDYWHTAPGEMIRPNSKTYRADVGLQILPRHIIYGQVYTGYLVQKYDESSLGSTSAPDYGGQLVWNVTPLTTLTFNGLRSFITGSFANPATGISGPAGNGYLASTVQVVADHELFRNLLLNANASYENDSFQGITRTDNVYTAGAGVRYLVNRYLFLGGTVNFQQRTSTAPGNSYTQYVVMGRIGTQF
jgi:hypothetical protein